MKKAGQKMNALSRVIPYMNITKRRTLLNTFFMPQLDYCLNMGVIVAKK